MKGYDLIKKKAKGFIFCHGPYIGWNSHMIDYVGKTGIITGYDDRNNSEPTYLVKFGYNEYWYPAIGIEEQFIEEIPEKELSIEELINQMKNLKSQI